MSVLSRSHPRRKPWRPQQDPPDCPRSTVPTKTNLEDLNEILRCVRVQPLPTMLNLEDINEILLCAHVQPFPSTTETLKTSTRSSSVSVFDRSHPQPKPWRPRPTTNCTLPPSSLTTECHSRRRRRCRRRWRPLKSRERILSAPQRMYTQNNDASNHLFENPGQKSLAKEAHKIGSLPKRVTTTVVGCSTNNCLTDLVVKHKNWRLWIRILSAT